MNRSNFWADMLVISLHCGVFMPFHHVAVWQGVNSACCDSFVHESLSCFLVGDVVSYAPDAKYCPLRLLFLGKNRSLGFSSNCNVGSHLLHWIWARVLVSHLHPLRTQHVYLGNIPQLRLLKRMFPVHCIRCNCDPALILWHNLDHRHFVSVYICVLDVSVIWIIHHSEVRGVVILVPVELSSRLLGHIFWSFWWWWPLATGLFVDVGINSVTCVISFFISRYLEFLLKDNFALGFEVRAALQPIWFLIVFIRSDWSMSIVKLLSLFQEFFSVSKALSSVDLPSLRHFHSEMAIKFVLW